MCSCMHVCLLSCICRCLLMHVHMCAYACETQKTTSKFFSHFRPPIYWNRLSMAWNQPNFVGRLFREPQTSTCLPQPKYVVPSPATMSRFFVLSSGREPRFFCLQGLHIHKWVITLPSPSVSLVNNVMCPVDIPKQMICLKLNVESDIENMNGATVYKWISELYEL